MFLYATSVVMENVLVPFLVFHHNFLTSDFGITKNDVDAIAEKKERSSTTPLRTMNRKASKQ